MTYTTKHTPGPWKAERNYAEVAVNERINIIADDILIAETHHAWMDWEEQEANAHLIAAAPAMYADGKVLCGLVRDFMNDNRLYDGQVIQAIHNLETALAQAEGKQKVS